MTGLITTGNIPLSLYPIVHKFWGDTDPIKPAQWKAMYEMRNSDRAFEVDALISNLTYVPQKQQGQSTTYTDFQQAYTTVYTHQSYALGVEFTKEAKDDGHYYDLVGQSMKKLREATDRTYELIGANIFNNGFSTSQLGGDGSPLFSATHSTQAGNQSNILSTAAVLSETSLEDLLIQINNATDYNGNFRGLQAESIHIAPAQQFELERILGSVLQYNTANNNINAMRQMGKFPKGMYVNQYLTSTTAFYIKTDEPNGVIHYNRTAPEFSMEDAFDQMATKMKVFFRFSNLWSSYQGYFASAGTGA